MQMINIVLIFFFFLLLSFYKFNILTPTKRQKIGEVCNFE